MALHNCDEVAVAGFSYNLSSPHAQLHYYEKQKMSAIKDVMHSTFCLFYFYVFDESVMSQESNDPLVCSDIATLLPPLSHIYYWGMCCSEAVNHDCV